MTLPITTLHGAPERIGTEHGRRFADDIRRYATDRVALAAAGTYSGTPMSVDRVLSIAESMLPAHERYSPSLYAEMLAMASSAGISPAEAVVVGGFTDVMDTLRAAGADDPPFEDDCTAVLVPDSRAGGAGFLAQTWDMHASAVDHVAMLDLRPDGAPRALVFTTTGCLGQIGMNEAGIAIGINNLAATDGTPGVTWPFAVRSALAHTDFDAAVATIVDADLAGAHSFLVLAADGRGCVVEAMPSRRHVTVLADTPLVHANHCLIATNVPVEAERPMPMVTSSHDRQADAEALLAEGPVDAERLMAFTRDTRSICRGPVAPEVTATCGAVVMRPATGDLWACKGVPTEVEYEHLRV